MMLNSINPKIKHQIVLTGGGTGGHIYPALAVAEALKEQITQDSQLYYIGNDNKLEAELLTKNDLKDYSGEVYSNYLGFLPIRAYPLVNKVNLFGIFSWVKSFLIAMFQSMKYLQEKKIDVVFGTGGYVAAPVFAAARVLKIPYIIHNLDAHIGLANKAFVRDAYALTSAFSLKTKPRNGHLMVTGNPVSKKFLKDVIQSERSEGNDKLHLLVTGGSQGAEAINTAIGNLLAKLLKLPIEIIHITGTQSYQEYVGKFLNGDESLYSNYSVQAYTHEMAKLCTWADLSVCRSGAMTIAEMSVSGVVPIFVPLPWAAHDHQRLNAQSLVSAGAALSINQAHKSNTVSQEEFEIKLYNSIKNFCENRDLLGNMQSKLSEFAEPHASEKLAELILNA